jgi:hypothetical protein
MAETGAVVKARPDLADGQAACRLENGLEIVLREGQKKSRLAALLNAPFTLWVFSALALGFLSYCFNNYSTCVNLQRTDNRQISKLFFEIHFRRDKISFLSNMGDSFESLQAATRRLDPEETYVFADFKEKKLVEIAFDLHTVISRWNLVSGTTAKMPPTTGSSGGEEKQNSAFQSDFVEAPPFDLSSEYWSAVYFRFVNSAMGHSPHDVLQDAQVLMKAQLEKEEKEKRALDIVGRLRLAANNLRNEPVFAAFLGPDESGEVISKCLERTFWPSW